MKPILIHIRKDTAEAFKEAAEQFKSKHRSEGYLSPIMVACFLKEFGKTAEVREQAEREIKYIIELKALIKRSG